MMLAPWRRVRRRMEWVGVRMSGLLRLREVHALVLLEGFRDLLEEASVVEEPVVLSTWDNEEVLRERELAPVRRERLDGLEVVSLDVFHVRVVPVVMHRPEGVRSTRFEHEATGETRPDDESIRTHRH